MMDAARERLWRGAGTTHGRWRCGPDSAERCRFAGDRLDQGGARPGAELRRAGGLPDAKQLRRGHAAHGAGVRSGDRHPAGRGRRLRSAHRAGHGAATACSAMRSAWAARKARRRRRAHFKPGPGISGTSTRRRRRPQRAANRTGGGYGGNTLDAMTRLGSNLANQEYGNWIRNLQPYQGAAHGGRWRQGRRARQSQPDAGPAGHLDGGPRHGGGGREERDPEEPGQHLHDRRQPDREPPARHRPGRRQARERARRRARGSNS